MITTPAVVILNYNGEKLLRQFLPSVIQNSPGASVYVIDNASTDGSVSVLHNEFPSVQAIILDKNYGFCGGYNKGLSKIKADYFVLLNSDVEVTPHWLEPIQSLLDEDEKIAAVQPKIISWHHKTKFEYAGAGGGFIDSLGYPFCRGRIFDHTEVDSHQYDDIRRIFWGSGACLVIRSSAYFQFGGLDEDLFAHMEEIDLCWKLNRAGYHVYYCGQSTVYHVGAGTLGYDSPRKVYLNFRNGLTLIFKHFDNKELLYKLPIRMLLDWIAAIRFLTQGNRGSFISVLRAHYDFIGGLKRERRKRAVLHKSYPSYPRANIYPGLIIIDYYLRKKKSIDVNNPR